MNKRYRKAVLVGAVLVISMFALLIGTVTYLKCFGTSEAEEEPEAEVETGQGQEVPTVPVLPTTRTIGIVYKISSKQIWYSKPQGWVAWDGETLKLSRKDAFSGEMLAWTVCSYSEYPNYSVELLPGDVITIDYSATGLVNAKLEFKYEGIIKKTLDMKTDARHKEEFVVENRFSFTDISIYFKYTYTSTSPLQIFLLKVDRYS